MSPLEQKIRAFRDETIARNTATYGEKAAIFIDDVTGNALKTGMLISMLAGLPPHLMEILIARFSALSSQLYDAKGQLAGFSEDEIDKYIEVGHVIADEFRDIVIPSRTNTPSLVVPNHLH